MATIRLIVITKTSYSNQWPLDWFNTHVITTRLKHTVIVSPMAHTWAFKTCCYKLNDFCLPSHNRIVVFNSKVFSNIITLLANLILTRVFNFWSHIPLSMHALSHSNLPFPNFFGHVMVFCNLAWASFTFIKVTPTKILSSSIAYWQTLNMTCPKQVPLYTHNIFKGSISIIDYNAITINPKLLPSSFTKARTRWIKPNFSNKPWITKPWRCP